MVVGKVQIVGFYGYLLHTNILKMIGFGEGNKNMSNSWYNHERSGCLCSACLCWCDRKTTGDWRLEDKTDWKGLNYRQNIGYVLFECFLSFVFHFYFNSNHDFAASKIQIQIHIQIHIQILGSLLITITEYLGLQRLFSSGEFSLFITITSLC